MQYKFRICVLFGQVISLICYVLTIAIYLYVKKLRNTLGKCIISSLFSMVMVQLIFVAFEWDLDLIMVFFLELFTALSFFMFSYFIWISVISYHLWQVFKPLKTDEHRYQFLVYSAIVWFTAASAIGLLAFLDGHRLWGTTLLFYLFGWLILSIFNLIMFILTAINISKVKKEIKRLEHRRETTTTCIHFDTEAYLIFLRMSVMMGVSWILCAIIVVIDILTSKYREKLIVVLLNGHLCFGILIFILLICKRSTIKLLKESIRGRHPRLRELV